MIMALIIDKDKNTVTIDLTAEEYRNVFNNKKIDTKKIKRHRTLKELDKEVRDYLNLEIFKDKR